RPHRFPPIRRPNHASRFEGILKMKLQAFRVSDPETLQSQLDQTARKRLSVSGLEVFHGRLTPVEGRGLVPGITNPLHGRRCFYVTQFRLTSRPLKSWFEGWPHLPRPGVGPGGWRAKSS